MDWMLILRHTTPALKIKVTPPKSAAASPRLIAFSDSGAKEKSISDRENERRVYNNNFTSSSFFLFYFSRYTKAGRWISAYSSYLAVFLSTLPSAMVEHNNFYRWKNKMAQRDDAFFSCRVRFTFNFYATMQGHCAKSPQFRPFSGKGNAPQRKRKA